MLPGIKRGLRGEGPGVEPWQVPATGGRCASAPAAAHPRQCLLALALGAPSLPAPRQSEDCVFMPLTSASPTARQTPQCAWHRGAVRKRS